MYDYIYVYVWSYVYIYIYMIWYVSYGNLMQYQSYTPIQAFSNYPEICFSPKDGPQTMVVWALVDEVDSFYVNHARFIEGIATVYKPWLPQLEMR